MEKKIPGRTGRFRVQSIHPSNRPTDGFGCVALAGLLARGSKPGRPSQSHRDQWSLALRSPLTVAGAAADFPKPGFTAFPLPLYRGTNVR
jgi:hypothetical protein